MTANIFDIDIIPSAAGDVDFAVRGKTADTGRSLLQRLFILVLSEADSYTYRPDASSTGLLSFLEGGNIPEDAMMSAIVAVCCSSAVSQLADEDKEQVSSFTGTAEDGRITCTLTLKDGTTLSGVI